MLSSNFKALGGQKPFRRTRRSRRRTSVFGKFFTHSEGVQCAKRSWSFMITKQEDCASKICQKKKVRNWLRWSQQRIWKVYCRIKINIFCLNVYFDLWWWFVQGVEWFKFACWQIWASQEHWKWEVIVWQDQRQSKHVKATRDIKRWRHVQINLVLRSHCFQSNHPHCIAFSTPWKQVVESREQLWASSFSTSSPLVCTPFSWKCWKRDFKEHT